LAGTCPWRYHTNQGIRQEQVASGRGVAPHGAHSISTEGRLRRLVEPRLADCNSFALLKVVSSLLLCVLLVNAVHQQKYALAYAKRGA